MIRHMTAGAENYLLQEDIYRLRLNQILDQQHELVQLSDRIDWSVLEKAWGPNISSACGKTVLPTRLVAGLHYLKQSYCLTKEELLDRWCENPYWQYFCGEEYFRHELPCNSVRLMQF